MSDSDLTNNPRDAWLCGEPEAPGFIHRSDVPVHDLGHPDPVGQVILGAEPLWALVRVLAAHNVRLSEVGGHDGWTSALEQDLRGVLDWQRRHGS